MLELLSRTRLPVLMAVELSMFRVTAEMRVVPLYVFDPDNVNCPPDPLRMMPAMLFVLAIFPVNTMEPPEACVIPCVAEFAPPRTMFELMVLVPEVLVALMDWAAVVPAPVLVKVIADAVLESV